jgi:hypothetical protein
MAARAVRLLIINGTPPFRTLAWALAAAALCADVLLAQAEGLTSVALPKRTDSISGNSSHSRSKSVLNLKCARDC